MSYNKIGPEFEGGPVFPSEAITRSTGKDPAAEKITGIFQKRLSPPPALKDDSFFRSFHQFAVQELYTEFSKTYDVKEQEHGDVLDIFMKAAKDGKVSQRTTTFLLLSLLIVTEEYEQPNLVANALLSHIQTDKAFVNEEKTFDPGKVKLKDVHSSVKRFNENKSLVIVGQNQVSTMQPWPQKKSPQTQACTKWKQALKEFMAYHGLDQPSIITDQSGHVAIGFKAQQGAAAATSTQQKSTASNKQTEVGGPGLAKAKVEKGTVDPNSQKARQDQRNVGFREAEIKNKEDHKINLQ